MGESPPLAFSHRRAAVRYIEKIVKDRWTQLTDFDVVGAANRSQVVQLAAAGHDETSYTYRVHKERLEQELTAARNLIDRGFDRFRRDYDMNYGPMPIIEEVKLYRTYADFNAPRE
jgi:hypothetical protein